MRKAYISGKRAKAGILVFTMDLKLPVGSSQYIFPDPRGAGREITVFTHRPAAWPADGKVVIVMHGRGRNGADYRNWWVADAERHGALVIVPEFSERHYARERCRATNGSSR